MTTAKNDVQNRTEVASGAKVARTTKKTATPPLVGNVTAGAQATSSAPVTLLSLLQEAAASKRGLPKVSDRLIQAFLKTTHNVDVAEFEHELVSWTQGHRNPLCAFEDPDYLADAEECGSTPASIIAEYLAWRAARLQFCEEVRAYLAFVDADEAKRQAEENFREANS